MADIVELIGLYKKYTDSRCIILERDLERFLEELITELEELISSENYQNYELITIKHNNLKILVIIAVEENNIFYNKFLVQRFITVK